MKSVIKRTALWFGIAGMAALFAVQAGAATPSHFFPMTVGAIDGIWTTDLDAAKALSAANGRPMLIYVGNTAECGYCRLSEENVLLVAAWQNYALTRGLALVYLDKTDARYMSYVSGTSGAFPIFSVYQCPTPTTPTLYGRFTYRPWSTTTTQYIYNGIKVVQNPANFIAIMESYLGAPVAPLPVMTDDYADVRGDATAAQATELTALVKAQLTPKHALNGADTDDWFHMPVLAGGTYRLQNVGVRLVGATPTVSVYKDDPAGAPVAQYPLSDTNLHEFVAASAGAYYIRVNRPPAAGVDVNYWLQYQRYVALPVVNGPDDAFVALGQTATFTVTVDGEGPFTYQWYKGTYILAGATGSSYSIALTTALKGALYKCKVTNLAGSAFSRVATLGEAGSAKLQVNLTPAGAVTAGARWSPNGGTTWYTSGTIATLATGTYTITFKPTVGWTAPADLTNVTLSPAYATTPLVLAGAYTAASISLSPDTLTLSSNQQDTVINVTATPADLAWTATPSDGWITIVGEASGTGSGSFTVRVANNSGLTARSGSVAVGTASLAITQNPYRPDGKLTVTLLPALAAGNGGQWTPNAGADWYASGAVVSLPQGAYTVAYKPVAGWTTPASAGATVTVAHTNTPLALTGTYVPVLAVAPASIQTNSPATDVSVSVTAPAGYDWTAVPSAAWLTISGPASGSGAGTFTLHLASNDTVAVRSGTVAVAGQTVAVSQQPTGGTGPLTIVEQPKAQKIFYGTTATLHVRATGAGPITYQWRKSTLAVAGATLPDFTTPALTATTTYNCLVKNPVSSKASTSATITVVRMWRAITGNVVTLSLAPVSGTTAWTVTEKIPAGLIPADYAASGGTWNATARTIVWTSTGGKNVSYSLSGPAGAYTLSGTVKWSRFTVAATIAGDTALVLPATLARPGIGFLLQTLPGL